ncbi:Helix-turn-helix [Lachnospiraceae bacterium XPB1003]|nr:Helix-turn-helix [Lachnospiraceae bacterium XPB1003]
MSTNISNILKRYRQINNFSQSDLAKHLGISASAYNHYESGNREPSISILTTLAKLYHLEDQILGVYQSNTWGNNNYSNYTMKQLLDGIKSPEGNYSLTAKYENKKIVLLSSQFKALCDYFSKYSDYKRDIFTELSKSKSDNEGKLYEALTYAWLEKQGIHFSPQERINEGECLNPHGYIADGIIDESVVFDVKMFGITQPNLIRLQKKLNEMRVNNHNDYYITISGSTDLSNNTVQELLSKSNSLYNSLFLEENKHNKDYWITIPKTDLEIRAHYTTGPKIISTISEFNPYKWAMENQYYFFRDASQFCTQKPFVIICPYDSKTARQFTGSFRDSTMAAFRSLCRRMFLGMSDEIDVNEFDKKCSPIVSVKSASKCISAVIFQDISMHSGNDDTWIFINPYARNKVSGYILNEFRYHIQSMFEDFAYDTYP